MASPPLKPSSVGRQTVMDNQEPKFASIFLAELKAALGGSTDPDIALLRTHLFIEQAIGEALERALPVAEVLFDREAGLRFHQKARILRSIGFLSQGTLAFLLELNRLRNRFAHRLGYTLSERDIEAIGSHCPEQFRAFKAEHPSESMTWFNKAISLLVGRFCGELEGGRLVLENLANEKTSGAGSLTAID